MTMASPPPSLDRSSNPTSLFPRRPSASGNQYAPPTPSPLSPYFVANAAPTAVVPPPKTFPTNSHYYRPPRSSLTSPTRSNISTPTGSPTRTSRQTRIQSLLASDPLLSRLTPITIVRFANDAEFGFTTAEKEWSIRAADGIVKVGEWLREAEGWNLNWRRVSGQRGSKHVAGRDMAAGYLPPSPDRPKKRRKLVVGEESVEGGENGGMKSIREVNEEQEKEEEEEEDEDLEGSFRVLTKQTRRRLFVQWSGEASDKEEDLPEVLLPPPQADSSNARHPRKPPTPYQLKLQRQKAAEQAEESISAQPTKQTAFPTPQQTPVTAKKVVEVSRRENHHQKEEEISEEEGSEEEGEEGEEYWGSLRKSTVEKYEKRIAFIKSEIEELEVEALKSKVLSYRTGTTNPLTDSSAIITATTLQLLPPLHRLTKLLSLWTVRLAILRVVPVFLRWLGIARDALDAGYAAINHPSISPNHPSHNSDTSSPIWRGLEEETYTLLQETISQKVATVGRLMDTMLDTLEGREDILPDLWISELEEVEECFGAWEMDGERVVLEGRLRLDDLRHHQTRREELEREREKTALVLEQERSVREAEQVDVEVEGVMERAEETERGLREAMEANEIVAEGIELGDDVDGVGSPVEGNGGEWVGRELLMKLESVEKMRMARSWSIGSETETEAEWIDASEERWRVSRGGSTDVGGGIGGVRRHGLSLDPIHIEKRLSGISTYSTPMPTSWFLQNGYVPGDHAPRGLGPFLHSGDIAPARSYPAQHPAVVQTHPATAQLHPPVTQTHPAVIQTHPSVIQVHPAATETHPSVAQSHPAVTQVHPSTIQIHPSVTQNHPAVTQIHPSTTQTHPTTHTPAASTPQTPPPKSRKERSASSSPEIANGLPRVLAAARSFFGVGEQLGIGRELERESEKVLAAQAKAEEKERQKSEEEEIDRLAELEAAKFFEECERAAEAEAEEEEEQWADEREREREREREEEAERNMVWKAAAEQGLWVDAGGAQREQIAIHQMAAFAVAEAEAQRREVIEEAEHRQRSGGAEKVESEAERKRRASLERVSSLEAARLSTEAEHQRLLAEEAAFIVAEERQRLEKEREAHTERILANQEEAAAERTRLVTAASEGERRRHCKEEAVHFAAVEGRRITTEAERQRLAGEVERQKVEASRLAAVEAARIDAEAEADRLQEKEAERLAVLETERLAAEAEEKHQKEADRQRVAAATEIERQKLLDEEAALVSAAEAEAEAEAERNVEAKAECQRLADGTEKQKKLEIERLATLEAALLQAEAEAEVRRVGEETARQHGAELELLTIEVEHQRMVALETERQRAIEEESRKQKEEHQRLAIEATRVAAEESERQRAVDQQKAEVETLATLAIKHKQILTQQLAEQERQLLVTQEAERLNREREIEEARIRAEVVKEEEERRRQESLLAAEKHTGCNSEGGSISGDDVTEEYLDVSRVRKLLPSKESDEDSEVDRIRLSKSHTSQPPVPPPSAEMTPVTSRSSSAQGAPEWSPESPAITSASAKATQGVSDGSSDFGSEGELLAAENRAAHDSLQKALSNSVKRELPTAFKGPDRLIPEISLTEMPSILVAPSTPQNPSGFDEPEHTPGAAVWDRSVNSPVFDDIDSFGDGPFLTIDENSYLVVEDYGAEDDSSDFDIAPLATSTPKPARRLGRLSGLDSITEVLTPYTPHDQYFKAFDGSRLNDDDTPSKRGGGGNLTLPGGFSRDGDDSDGSSGGGHFNDPRQWAPIPLDMSSARPGSSMSNKSSMSNISTKVRYTPEAGPSIKTQRSQRFTRKAPLDMSRPRSLSSTGDRPRSLSATGDYYISPGLTSPKATPKGPLRVPSGERPRAPSAASDYYTAPGSKVPPRAMLKGPLRAPSGERPRAPSASSDYYTAPSSTSSKAPPKTMQRGPSRGPSGERPRPPSSSGDYVPTSLTNPKALPKALLKGAPKGALGPAMKAIRRSRKDIDSDDESVAREPRWSRSRDNTPDWASPPPTPNPGRLSVAKSRQPSNFAGRVTPDRNRRLYQSGASFNQEGPSLVPQTPKLQFPQQSLDDKVNGILAALASPVRLTASNLQKLSETTNKRQASLRSFETPSSIPAPRSISSNPSVTSDAASFSRGGRRHVPSIPDDIKLYHLHRTDGQAPIKLYIRLVGEKGERVMVRVGGGWADLAEYLKEYATHHGSKRRVVSEGRIEIQDFGGTAHHHSLHPSRSISSLRSASPAPGSRPGSPHTGNRSPHAGNRSRSASALGLGRRAESPFSRRAESPSLASPPRIAMRGGHNGTTKDLPITPTLPAFQPLTYQRQSGLSPPTGSRPPSRPGSSHSAVGVIRRSASRLSFTSAFESGDMASLIDPGPPMPLGLAGPKGKNSEISPENQAWVEGMLGEVQKVSAGRRRRLTGGSNNGDMDLIPGEMMELQPGIGGQQFGGRLGISDMGKQGGTWRVFPRQG